MGILDKVKFWKKKDDFSDLDLGKDFDLGADDLGLGETGNTSPGNNFGAPVDSSNSYQSFHQDSINESGQNMRPQSLMPQSSNQYTQPDTQSVPNYQQFNQSGSTDMQLISAKLDAIKAYLDTINQRLTNLENIARGHNERQW